MLQLAWPVAIAELGWMGMSLVDTMMVGRVGAIALGAVSIGSHLFFAVAIFGMGMLLGLDYTVALAVGGGAMQEARRALVHGIYLSLPLAAGLIVVLLALTQQLERLGIQPEVARATAPYLYALTWSLPPLLLFAALRRYLQALGKVRAVMAALLTANAINALACWVLIFGHAGAPALGAEGAGWATCISRVYLLVFLLAYAAWHEQRSGRGLALPWRAEARRLHHLARLGLPAALQMLLEVGVFATATVLAGRLSADALAAHQVALSAAAFNFMVPLGISSAASVRVGRAIGRVDPSGAARARWTAVLLGALFMSGAALVFFAAPAAVIRIFTDDAAVIATGAALLVVAAVFQLFDGVQVVVTGALRGSGDTRTPMLANLIGHWVLGLPIGYALCFWLDRGVVGLWIGLCTGLVSVALALIVVWRRRTLALAVDYPNTTVARR